MTDAVPLLATTKTVVFCDKLRLLRLCNYRNTEHSSRHTAKLVVLPRKRQARRIQQSLDTLCAVLTTSPKQQLAAALDTRGQNPLVVLACSRPTKSSPTFDDKHGATEILQLLLNPKTKDYTDVLPFVARRGYKQLRHRITQLHDILVDTRGTIHPALLPKRKQGESSASTKVEDKSHSTQSLYLNTLHHCIIHSERQTWAEQASHTGDILPPFNDLIQSAGILFDSRELKTLVKGEKELGIDGVASKLERRLGKVLRYGPGVDSLIRSAREIATGDILHHQWVDSTPLAPNGVASGRDVWSVLRDNLQVSVSEDFRAECLARYPKLSQWNPVYHPFVHPEVLIVEHFSETEGRGTNEQHYVMGGSKRACAACYEWMDCSPAHWTPGAVSGKLDPSWAAPITVGQSCLAVTSAVSRAFEERFSATSPAAMEQLLGLIDDRDEAYESAEENDSDEVASAASVDDYDDWEMASDDELDDWVLASSDGRGVMVGV